MVALALAAAADELLHATWAELALVKAPPPAIPPPAVLSRRKRRSFPRPLLAASRWGRDEHGPFHGRADAVGARCVRPLGVVAPFGAPSCGWAPGGHSREMARQCDFTRERSPGASANGQSMRAPRLVSTSLRGCARRTSRSKPTRAPPPTGAALGVHLHGRTAAHVFHPDRLRAAVRRGCSVGAPLRSVSAVDNGGPQ